MREFALPGDAGSENTAGCIAQAADRLKHEPGARTLFLVVNLDALKVADMALIGSLTATNVAVVDSCSDVVPCTSAREALRKKLLAADALTVRITDPFGLILFPN